MRTGKHCSEYVVARASAINSFPLAETQKLSWLDTIGQEICGWATSNGVAYGIG